MYIYINHIIQQTIRLPCNSMLQQGFDFTQRHVLHHGMNVPKLNAGFGHRENCTREKKKKKKTGTHIEKENA